MLRKLLKYDFLAIWRFWWIMAGAALGLSLISSVLVRLTLVNTTVTLLQGLTGIVSALSLFVIFAMVFASPFLIYIRFYQHFYTDEGYLTFTLPVSRRTMLFSQMLTYLIFTGLQIVLLFACLTIISLIIPPADSGSFLFAFQIFDGIGELFSTLWQTVGAWTILYTLEVLFAAIGGLVFSASLIFFCITLGSVVAKKHKVAASFGIYYLVNMVLSFFGSFAIVQGIVTFVEGMSVVGSGWPPFAGRAMLALLILLIGLFLAALGLTVYFLTQHLIDRKLNLA